MQTFSLNVNDDGNQSIPSKSLSIDPWSLTVGSWTLSGKSAMNSSDPNPKGRDRITNIESTESGKQPQYEADSILFTEFKQWEPYHSELQVEDCLQADTKEKTPSQTNKCSQEITNILWAPKMKKKTMSRIANGTDNEREQNKDRPSSRCRKILNFDDCDSEEDEIRFEHYDAQTSDDMKDDSYDILSELSFFDDEEAEMSQSTDSWSLTTESLTLSVISSMNELKSEETDNATVIESTDYGKEAQHDADPLLSTEFKQWQPYSSGLQVEDYLQVESEEKTPSQTHKYARDISNILWAPKMKNKTMSRIANGADNESEQDKDRPSFRCRKILNFDDCDGKEDESCFEDCDSQTSDDMKDDSYDILSELSFFDDEEPETEDNEMDGLVL